MKVILFGATGMVGKGVLRQCLLDPHVDSVLSIGRKPSGVSDPKLCDLVRCDMFDIPGVGGRSSRTVLFAGVTSVLPAASCL